MVIATGTLAIFGALGAASDGGWALWFAALFFGPLCIFAITQLLNRKPAVVIDDDGIADHRSGLRLSWEEVEGVRLSVFRVRRFSRQHWLLLRVTDLDAVVARLPKKVGRAAGRLDAKMGRKEALIVLNLLERSPKEVLEAVRRSYRGPVES